MGSNIVNSSKFAAWLMMLKYGVDNRRKQSGCYFLHRASDSELEDNGRKLLTELLYITHLCKNLVEHLISSDLWNTLHPEYVRVYLAILCKLRSPKKWGVHAREAERQKNFFPSSFCLCLRGWNQSPIEVGFGANGWNSPSLEIWQICFLKLTITHLRSLTRTNTYLLLTTYHLILTTDHLLLTTYF